MVHGTDVPQMTVIDEITAHVGTVTAIIEAEMTGGRETTDGKEMRGETGVGETTAGIVGMRTAEGVLHMPRSDGILPSLPIVHPMAPHVPEGRLILIGRRASESFSRNFLLFAALTRIHTESLLIHCGGHPHHVRKRLSCNLILLRAHAHKIPHLLYNLSSSSS
jgi:hypothetical protein